MEKQRSTLFALNAGSTIGSTPSNPHVLVGVTCSFEGPSVRPSQASVQVLTRAVETRMGVSVSSMLIDQTRSGFRVIFHLHPTRFLPGVVPDEIETRTPKTRWWNWISRRTSRVVGRIFGT